MSQGMKPDAPMAPAGELDHLAAPLIVNWSLSFRCNFDCRHCYTRLDTSPELDTARVKAISDKLAAAGVMFVNFGGGEPLLRADLMEVAHHAAGRGLQLSMNTNGWLVDGATAAALAEAGFTSVGVSLDSHDPALHDGFRNRRGSHERAVGAVRNLREAGLAVTVSSVISRLNNLALRELVAMAGELGVSRLFLHNFKCSGKGMANRFELDLEPAEWREFYALALEVERENPAVPISFDDPIINSLGSRAEPGSMKGSTCGKMSLNIRPNGDITPCGFIPLVLGNALADDILGIWEDSDVLSRMRHKKPKGKCVSCPSYGECLGGCTARALAVGGDMEEPDPHCWQE